MGRRITVVLLLMSLLLVWGCSAGIDEADMTCPAKFFYKVRVDDEQYDALEKAVDYEAFEMAGHESDYEWILNAYFDGPESGELIAPFPKSTALISVKMDGATMYVDISEHLSRLSGIDLTIACSCITLTCLEFEGVESVTIRADGRLLNGSPTLTMNRDSLILEDVGSNIATSVYTLYFSDTDNRYLIGEEVELDLDTQEPHRELLRRLIEGPAEAGLAQTVPMETEILNLEINDGVCNLDLSRAFVDNAPKTELAQRMTILSITNTLTQLDGVDSLALSLEGHRLEHYGAMDLRQPLTFEERAIGPARTSLNELDADLYLYIGDSTLLSRVPVRVRQTADKMTVEQILEQLLEYSAQNGYSSKIPAGTRLLSVLAEQDVCVITLSQDFLQKSPERELATRSVCATVLANGEYEAVLVVVDGEEKEDGDFRVITWDDSWLSEFEPQ